MIVELLLYLYIHGIKSKSERILRIWFILWDNQNEHPSAVCRENETFILSMVNNIKLQQVLCRLLDILCATNNKNKINWTKPTHETFLLIPIHDQISCFPFSTDRQFSMFSYPTRYIHTILLYNTPIQF